MTEEDVENNESYEAGCSWSLIPSARSSQTVRRQEKVMDINGLKGNSNKNSSYDLNREVSCDEHVLPVGVCSKIVTRSSSLNDDARSSKTLGGFTLTDCLPHPSTLKKRKQSCSKKMRSARRNQCGFDVRVHVAQLRRKHAEFNWFPSQPKTDITSPLRTGDVFDEEPFPPRSNGSQCVPGTPTLGFNDFFELQNSEWSWQLPTFHNRENVMPDLFKDQNGVPGKPFSVPSFAVATREQFQEDLIIFSNNNLSAFSPALENGAPNLTPCSIKPHLFSPEFPCFALVDHLKEE